MKLLSKPRSESFNAPGAMISRSESTLESYADCDSRTKIETTMTAANAGIEASRNILLKSLAVGALRSAAKDQYQQVAEQRPDDCAGVVHRAVQPKRQTAFLKRQRCRRSSRHAGRCAHPFPTRSASRMPNT